MKIYKDWSELKTTISTKKLAMQFEETANKYTIWAAENGDIYKTEIYKENPASVEQTDFEDNYKVDANKALNIGEDKIVDALQIRDTSDHNSSVSDSRGFVPKTIIVENSLDQDVTIQMCGARDSAFTKPINIGNSFVISANAEGYATLSDYFPYILAKVTCDTAPTTGDVTIYLERVKA